jgi:hypothetical protein
MIIISASAMALLVTYVTYVCPHVTVAEQIFIKFDIVEFC